MSMLWSAIAVDLACPGPPPSTLYLFLERSSEREVDIEITHSSGNNILVEDERTWKMEVASAGVVLLQLIPSLNRWSSFRVWIPFEHVLEEFIGFLQGPADFLKELRIVYDVDDFHMLPLPSARFPVQFTARNLLILELDRIMCYEEPAFGQAFPALQTLIMKCAIPRSLRNFLRSLEPLKQLHVFQLHFKGDGGDDQLLDDANDGSGRVTLARLEVLSVYEASTNHMSAVFPILIAPRMTQFHCQDPSYAVWENLPVPVPLPQHFPLLREITFTRRGVQDIDEMEQWFLSVPVKFTMVIFPSIDCQEIDQFLEHAADTDDDDEFFPALGGVTMHGYDDVPVDAFRSMVEVRTQYRGIERPRLQRLCIHTEDELSAEDREWFEDNLKYFEWSTMPSDQALLALQFVYRP